MALLNRSPTTCYRIEVRPNASEAAQHPVWMVWAASLLCRLHTTPPVVSMRVRGGETQGFTSPLRTHSLAIAMCFASGFFCSLSGVRTSRIPSR
jgi:hypothetical protein